MATQAEEKAEAAKSIRYYLGMAGQLALDPMFPVNALEELVSNLDNTIFEFNNGNFQKVDANLNFVKLIRAIRNARDDAKCLKA